MSETIFIFVTNAIAVAVKMEKDIQHNLSCISVNSQHI